MYNRDIFLQDPTKCHLVNEGVANVNDETQSVFRYELETFVCDGQYEKGMEHVFQTFLSNINRGAPQQPGVWVSGFYGSGKSHLVKVMGALWKDITFEDGSTARGITDLPPGITDLLKELTTQGKRHGGLHAATGTLGSGAIGSVRLALLRIIFKSVGLPEQYHVARFVMWLKDEGIYETVKNHVENNGFDWEEELDNFYVAEGLHDALVKVKPNLFSSTAICVETLNNLYPYVQDVSSDDMLKAIQAALTREGKFPLTLIVLDEVQQYIGENSERSINVQEAVEACCKKIGGKVLFIGTGQTAVTGTSNLKKLEGRFTIRVELSDADVDAVIRKVILAKKPDAIKPIEKNMQTNLGEISRHLSDTTIGHRQDDIQHFVKDYPILPIRRRFWENTLRVLDQTGTESQLRNQLSMVHKVIQTNIDKEIGHVVPADYLYFDSADKLLQSRILPRKVHEKTMIWIRESADERLMARACGLIFLINKLSGTNNEIGIKASVDTIADLMVEDLLEGSSNIRGKLPAILDKCQLLMKVGDEYRIQTEESAAWTDEFLNQRSILANEVHRIEAERDDRIRQKFGQQVKRPSIIHGKSKVNRDLSPVFGSQLPPDSDRKICIWIRDGWNIDENSVRVDARQAGNQSPTIFVFIPKRSADDLRHHLIDYKASSTTLEIRGVPNTPEGVEARAAMETIKQTAEGKISELLNETFSSVRVFQGGGNEISGNNLQEMILEAGENALKRLYPQFHIADHEAWEKVYSKAKQGSPDALKAVGYEGDAESHPVCKSILGFIAVGKKGIDIRTHFEEAQFGWSRDAVDGGLQTLLISGKVRAHDERGQLVDPRELERKMISKHTFKVEIDTVPTAQRIQIRKLFQMLKIQAVQGQELMMVQSFIDEMRSLAENAGGERPKPEQPDISMLEEVRLSSGNAQLLSIYNYRDEIKNVIEDWRNLGKRVSDRMPKWQTLLRLLDYADSMDNIEIYRSQATQIESKRLLLQEPDPVTPLVANITQMLRDILNRLQDEYKASYEEGFERLESNPDWQQLEPEQKHAFLLPHQLTEATQPKINLKDTDAIIQTLQNLSLTALSDRIAALPARFDSVAAEATTLIVPEAQFLQVPRRTLRTPEEIDAWADEVKQQLKDALTKGPVVIQ